MLRVPLLVSLICALLPQLFVTTAQTSDRSEAERAFRNGDYEVAERIFREALLNDDRDVQLNLGLSYTLLKRGKFQAAYDLAIKVLSINRQSNRAFSLAGSALLATGNFGPAKNAFNEALHLNHNEALAIGGLGVIDFHENRLKSSYSKLRKAVAKDRTNSDLVLHLAQVAARLERFKEAAEAYEHFLTVAPRSDEDRRARIKGLIAFLRYLGTQKKLYVIDGPSTIRIPFELVNNRPVITVSINGSQPLRFVLDSGSGMSVVSDRVARTYGLPPIARGGTSRGIGGDGRIEIVYGLLSSLRMGNVEIRNIPVYQRPFFGQGEVDGYLGLAAIEKHVVTVDYGARTLILTRPKAKISPTPISYVTEIPIRRTSSSLLSGEVEIGGVNAKLHFIIDTGASVSVIDSRLSAQSGLERLKSGMPMRIIGSAGVAENVEATVLPQLTLGKHVQRDLFAVILSLDTINETTGFVQSGIIGGDLLRNFRVTFDFQKGIMSLERSASLP